MTSAVLIPLFGGSVPHYELSTDTQIQTGVFNLNQRKYARQPAPSAERGVNHAVSDGNVSVRFFVFFCRLEPLSPSKLQIHLLCVRRLRVSSRTRCPTFTELHKNTEAALVTVTRGRQGGELCVLGMKD